jgi:putative ABC transport system permease protein
MRRVALRTSPRCASARVGRSGISLVAIIAEAVVGLARQPVRTILCAFGTALAVGGFVALTGLTQSARNAVSSSFNELRATTVEFEGGSTNQIVLTPRGVNRLSQLHGVTGAGLLWSLDSEQPLSVSTTPPSDTIGSSNALLPFTAATPSTFAAIGARLSSGRFYDTGADRNHEMVAVLGASAAQQLGISSVVGEPAIFVGKVALTVVGIVQSTRQQAQLQLGVIVPPYVASVLSAAGAQRTVIARTLAGGAQLIGREGPYALAPYQAASIVAEVPPDPSTLRAQVESSLSDLLTVLAIAGFIIGIVAIGTVTLLSVLQRRYEIGLRRAIGYNRFDIARLILAEAIGTGLLGGIIGVSLGIITVSTVSSSHGWEPVLSPNVLVGAPAAGVTIGALAGAIPALRASRITPVAALRSG